MRRFSHWTPAYVRSRLAEIYYRRLCPDQPWLTQQANAALQSLLRPTDVGLEFGSGRSTIWFAKRVKHLTSVESDKAWFEKISSMLVVEGLHNVSYLFRDANPDDVEVGDDPFVDVTQDFPDASLDFVLVDGKQRGRCAWCSLPKIRPGGFLIIDNVNWFLPSTSRAPNSLCLAEVPRQEVWRDVHGALQNWRTLWTENGISDTAIFIKPCPSPRLGA